MREPYGEDVASHTDPESCVVSREAGYEVLTGTHAGRVSSREMAGNQDTDLVYSWGRQPSCLVRFKVLFANHSTSLDAIPRTS